MAAIIGQFPANFRFSGALLVGSGSVINEVKQANIFIKKKRFNLL